MQRLWDSARANRPSIYGKPEKPLIAQYDKSEKDSYVPTKKFGQFFLELVKKSKPVHPMDCQELYRLIAYGVGSNRFIRISLDKATTPSFPIKGVLAGCLAIRDIYMLLGFDEQKATELTLEHISSKYMFEMYFPHRSSSFIEDTISGISIMLTRRGGGFQSVHREKTGNHRNP